MASRTARMVFPLFDRRSRSYLLGAMPAEILSIRTPELFQQAALRAAALLKAGKVVALPTETVYGLAANAMDPAAVSAIYQIKGRPSHNPLIVHVASRQMARNCADGWPELAERLADAFWPGPLTMVLPKSEAIPSIVTAGGPTVALRWPQHPLMREVIRQCGFPLAAPSANRSNEISPTNARHVIQSLGGQLPLIVDGGDSNVGIESTVLDITVSPPRVLRPGIIHDESLMAVTGSLASVSGQEHGPLKSPGQLERHYAPKASLVVTSWETDDELNGVVRNRGMRPEETCIICHSHIPAQGSWAAVKVIPHDPEAVARALYGELHQCDEMKVRWIVFEAVPDASPWRGISDRLRRASSS